MSNYQQLIKFNPGELPEHQVHRSRLYDQMLNHSPAKAIFLHAPAGYGKTVSMAQAFHIAKQHSEQVAWISCDIRDREPEIFVESLILAVQHTGAPIQYETRDLTSLLRIFDGRDQLLRIFIDEYESIGGALVDDIMSRLILLLPPQVQLIIATRKVPEKHYSRLTLEGKVSAIEAGELRFTHAEAEDLLAQSFSREELATVIDFAEGWPLVLQLANIKQKHSVNKHAIIEALKNPNCESFAYLAEQVFSALSAEQQEFLKDCSILTYISADTARAVTEQDKAFELLASLMELQPIVTVVTTTPLTVKLHPLFREFLVQSVQQRGERYVNALHTKASLHYINNQEPENAIVQAKLARSHELIVTIIEMSGGIRFIVDQGAPSVNSLLKWVPQSLINTKPMLGALQAILSMIEGNGRLAKQHYRQFSAQLAQSGNGGDNGTDSDSHLKDMADIYMALTGDLSSSIKDYMAEQFDAIEINLRQTLGADPRILCLIAAPKFFLLQRYGDVEQAKRSLKEYESLCENHGYARKLTSISPHLGLLAYNSGNFDTAIHHFSDALTHHWDRFNKREKLMSQLDNAVLAKIYYERNELDLSLANIEAIGATPDITFIEICEASSITLARCWLAQGKPEHAHNHLTETANRAKLSGLHNLAVMANANLVGYLLHSGKPDQATQLAKEHKLLAIWEQEAQPPRVLWPLLEHLMRALAPLLIHTKQAALAVRMTTIFCDIALAQGRNYMLALGLVFRAQATISAGAAGAEEEALELLTKAIYYTTDLAIVRPYIDAGADVILLLENVISSLNDEKQITHVQQINTVWNNQLKESKTSSLLTEREQDVLTELAKGHPTKVIARNLNLAPETIKYHLKHIYAKLGVGNRKEAVTEAWRKAMFS